MSKLCLLHAMVVLSLLAGCAKDHYEFRTAPLPDEQREKEPPKERPRGIVPHAERTVAGLTRHFHRCHQRAAVYLPEAQGKISLRFIVTPDGEVEELSVRKSGNLPRETVRCVLQAARAARFEPTVGGRALLDVPVQLVAQAH